jgi:DNA-binding MarR family transcriptional regulator
LTVNSKFEGEIATFLHNLHALNVSITQRLSPILEEMVGIDVRLYLILHSIEDGSVYPGAIAQAIHLPNSLVTKHLDQLTKRKLLVRQLDPQDCRRIRVSLTEEGISAVRAADEILTDLVSRRLARLSEEQRRAFLATLVILAEDPDPR